MCLLSVCRNIDTHSNIKATWLKSPVVAQAHTVQGQEMIACVGIEAANLDQVQTAIIPIIQNSTCVLGYPYETEAACSNAGPHPARPGKDCWCG